jgi:hypothetical protein
MRILRAILVAGLMLFAGLTAVAPAQAAGNVSLCSQWDYFGGVDTVCWNPGSSTVIVRKEVLGTFLGQCTLSPGRQCTLGGEVLGLQDYSSFRHMGNRIVDTVRVCLPLTGCQYSSHAFWRHYS